MLIDCDSCAVRDLACGDCVVSAILGREPGSVELDSAEQQALGALAGGGLLPPLRLVPTGVPNPEIRTPDGNSPQPTHKHRATG